MSEPIREQLAEFIAEQRDRYPRVPDDMDSEELADAILSRWSLSPVGETEAATIRLRVAFDLVEAVHGSYDADSTMGYYEAHRTVMEFVKSKLAEED